jgi:Calcineurin-like phosphoesterase
MNRRTTRRQALAELGLGTTAILLAACATSRPSPASDGSTLTSVWSDRTGDGSLSRGPGAPLIDRTDLAPAAARGREIARLAHLTDAHTLDAQSPARVTFLRRLGPPFNSTFRPHEALTAQVLKGAVEAINDFRPDAVIQGGDLIDNAQANELRQALSVLRGGHVGPASGSGSYVGVQSAADPDPFYYRPAIDAPRHPGLLSAALTSFHSPGLRAPVHPVLGDHDTLVAGVVPPTAITQQLAVGNRAVWDLPVELDIPHAIAAASPDGIRDAGEIDTLIRDLLTVPGVTVPADPRRHELSVAQALAGLRATPGPPLLDYHFDAGPHLRVIVLDLVRRDGGSDGTVQPGQPHWLATQLRAARDRWVIVVSHQPLGSSEGGATLLALLDRHPRTLAALSGHTHRNHIVARPAPNGGYWLITTASLIDFPQQSRALRIRPTADAGIAIETWMLDHVPDHGRLGDISRSLSYLDAQGGRPQHFAGTPLDRNVTLYRKPAN